jgi:hypothetical protein
MKTRITIDGASHTGGYRCDCDCGTTWNGRAESTGVADYSPALPVAEAVVHMQMNHKGAFLDLSFTARFREWLTSYWERCSLRVAQRQSRANPTTAAVLGR